MTCIAPKRIVAEVARKTGQTQEVVAKVLSAAFDQLLIDPTTVRGFGAFRWDVRGAQNRPLPGDSGSVALPARRRLVLRSKYVPMTEAEVKALGLEA